MRFRSLYKKNNYVGSDSDSVNFLFHVLLSFLPLVVLIAVLHVSITDYVTTVTSSPAQPD